MVGYLGILDAVMGLKKSTEITEYNIIPIGHVVLLVFVGIFLVIISEWVFIVPKIVVVLLNRIEYNRELSDGSVNWPHVSRHGKGVHLTGVTS